MAPTSPDAHEDFAPQGLAYLEGRMVAIEEAKISIATHAFNYGTGCFEGIRGYWHEEREEIYLVKLAEHYRRLQQSARLLQIQLPRPIEELCQVTVELVRRSDYRQDVYVRPVAYKAATALRVGLAGLSDGFCCFSAPMGAYFDIERGLHVTVSGWRRVDDNAIPARAKPTGGYLNAALAVSEAYQAGFDEAILLTSDGHVSEGTAANLFLVRDGHLVTPEVADDILVGLTRSAVFEIASKLRIPVLERRVDRTELFVADELFLCGTGVQVAPVTRVDGRVVGVGAMGPVTRAVQERYLAAVHGQDGDFASWLTPVYGRGS